MMTRDERRLTKELLLQMYRKNRYWEKVPVYYGTTARGADIHTAYDAGGMDAVRAHMAQTTDEYTQVLRSLHMMEHLPWPSDSEAIMITTQQAWLGNDYWQCWLLAVGPERLPDIKLQRTDRNLEMCYSVDAVFRRDSNLRIRSRDFMGLQRIAVTAEYVAKTLAPDVEAAAKHNAEGLMMELRATAIKSGRPIPDNDCAAIGAELYQHFVSVHMNSLMTDAHATKYAWAVNPLVLMDPNDPRVAASVDKNAVTTNNGKVFGVAPEAPSIVNANAALLAFSPVVAPCHYRVETTFNEGFGAPSVKKRTRGKRVISYVPYDRLYATFIGQRGDSEPTGRHVKPHQRRGHVRHLWYLAGIDSTKLPADPAERLALAINEHVPRVYISPTWIGTRSKVDGDVVHKITQGEQSLA